MVQLKPTRSAFLLGGAAALVAVSSKAGRGAGSEFLAGEGMPYAAFDRLPRTDIVVEGGTIHVGFAPGALALPRAEIFDWVRRSATAVTTYYGRFPVRSLRLLIVPVGGPGVQGGTTWGYRGAAIRILVGAEADTADLSRDWMMVHEMVHTALPDMDQRSNWLSEGLAVYVEPVARVQAGDLSPQTIWADMVRDMPQGLPGRGDAGLKGTQRWGRIYWGGAVFCLIADVGIRKATGNRLGLRDAMRGVLTAGGSHEVDWPIRRILATADRSVGVGVLSDLYADMGLRPTAPDLAALWRDLGIVATRGGIRFDDAATLAPIRSAITAP
ncbi:hypothetical protein [Methylobacterium haplocladii]|uniref:Peptidase M61 catalytic domain-containing protein n=1 Tax=Methylobacterium haplocladii TaxID=1176176 RepID=A0A512ISK5_9HYPH|nr:hypothetical protein [Methylobacterium haplocladii]GEP00694.1 hypothetical protein MHA02_30810 [Methylobacterium haplocladii]GJD82387.1 hypothetical protein HPGCJGGD_0241 [Methylobacterium haplocladii]GLS60783.1 hypothetical protein GCM10007887_34710 [Methylobacterium haplocladii]